MTLMYIESGYDNRDKSAARWSYVAIDAMGSRI